MNGKQYELHIDLNEAVFDSEAGTYKFRSRLEDSIKLATSITVSGVKLGDFTFNSCPAWYCVEAKYLFYGNGTNYFEVDGDTLAVPSDDN